MLNAEGYEHSPTDPCVMQHVVGDIIYFLLIYVDDILILAEQQEIEQMKEVFFEAFHVDHNGDCRETFLSWNVDKLTSWGGRD